MRIRCAVRIAWVALALTLTACARDEPPRPAAQTPPADPSVPATPAAAIALAEPVEVDEVQAAEAAQAQRLSDSRTYLEQARTIAQERHRLAILSCEAPEQGDRDACMAAADDVLQSELQAARAEFEAQMRQPN